MTKRAIQKRGRRADAGDAAVGTRIREARYRLKMSQSDLAVQCGVTFQQIQKYENAANRVSIGRLTKIAVGLGVTVTFLLTGAQERRGERGDNEGEALFKMQGALRLMKAYNRMGREKRQAIVALCESIARRGAITQAKSALLP
jgi:transcriptional regulator with XRE-family HTH domain